MPIDEVRDLLDAPAVPGAGDGVTQPWFGQVEASLAGSLPAWVALADASGGLTTDRSWRLLNWPEQAATQLVREPRADLVARGAVALSLLEGGPLDRREARVVGALLRRACVLTGTDFTAAVRAGCDRVGARGKACLDWLWWTVPDPGTHTEEGAGAAFRFRRIPAPEIDVEALERWAKGES